MERIQFLQTTVSAYSEFWLLLPALRECIEEQSEHVSFDHMNTKMYVGNLSFNATEQDLSDLFGTHGEVTEVFIPTDRESGRPRGFAFVTMESTDAMNDAISALNGNDFQGRPLVVNEAKPQTNTGGGGYRSNGGNGGRRDNNGYGRNRR